MATYASGKFSVGACMRCGLMFPYQDLRDDGDVKGLRVCHECFQEEHPQERPKRPRDPIALRKPSPENLPGVPSEVVFPIYLVDLGSYFGQNLAQWQIGQPSNNPSDTGDIAWASAAYTMSTTDNTVQIEAARGGSFLGGTYAAYAVTDAHGVVVPVAPGQFTWADADSANKTLTFTRAQNCAYDVTVTLSDPPATSSIGSPSTTTVSVEYDHSVANPDPYFSSVVSLLHFNGADGSTTFTDQTGKTWTSFGNAQIDTAQSKFGGSSGLFDGTGDYLTTPSHADWSLGSGDFTVECWVRPGGISGNKAIVSRRETAGLADGWYFSLQEGAPSMAVYGVVDGNDVIGAVTGGVAADLGEWSHVAAVRQGSSLFVFLNGALGATGSISGANINNNEPLRVGRHGNSIFNSRDFNGHIDDLRITKGVARYTCNFTPPANQFRDS